MRNWYKMIVLGQAINHNKNHGLPLRVWYPPTKSIEMSSQMQLGIGKWLKESCRVQQFCLMLLTCFTLAYDSHNIFPHLLPIEIGSYLVKGLMETFMCSCMELGYDIFPQG